MPKKILLADDSLTIQKVVELTFSDSDYELVCVSNGERALEKVREDRPDLILADVVMPEKNGYEVCEAIKGDPATSRIPVVLLSGTFEPFDRARAERIGADAIVSKPFDSQQLLTQVDALVARSPSSPAAPPVPTPIPQTTAAIAIPSVPPPPPLTAAQLEVPPFDVGFSQEDFTASVRLPPARSGIDPFEEEYVRGDVDSAIEAFEKAHPRFGYGSSLEAESGLSEQALDHSSRRAEAPRAEAPAEPAPAAREKEPQWLREEPERGPFALAGDDNAESGERADVASDPLEFAESSIEDEAATIAVSRSQMPTIPTVPADQLPTLEIPRSTFPRDLDRPGERRDLGEDRRSPVETAEASHREGSPFETAAASASTASPLEISETQAAILFDVSAPASAESFEPHAIAEPSEPEETEAEEAVDVRLAAAEPEGEGREPRIEPGQLEIVEDRIHDFRPTRSPDTKLHRVPPRYRPFPSRCTRWSPKRPTRMTPMTAMTPMRRSPGTSRCSRSAPRFPSSRRCCRACGPRETSATSSSTGSPRRSSKSSPTRSSARSPGR